MFIHVYRVAICIFFMATNILYGLESSCSQQAENVARAICSTGLIVGGLGFWKGAQPFFPIKGTQVMRNPFLTAFVFSSAATQAMNLKNQAQDFKNCVKQSVHPKANAAIVQIPFVSTSHQPIARNVAIGVGVVAVVGLFARKYSFKFFGKAINSRITTRQKNSGKIS